MLVFGLRLLVFFLWCFLLFSFCAFQPLSVSFSFIHVPAEMTASERKDKQQRSLSDGAEAAHTMHCSESIHVWAEHFSKVIDQLTAPALLWRYFGSVSSVLKKVCTYLVPFFPLAPQTAHFHLHFLGVISDLRRRGDQPLALTFISTPQKPSSGLG